MPEQRALFSESWHRVAGQRLGLRPSVRLRRQYFRGERWHIATDTFTGQFFRFRPEAHDFITRLDGTRTVEELWQGCLARNPETAPGQGEVIQMLAQLYHANLVVSDVPADTARLFERYRQRKQQEVKSQFFGIFFLRIRLWDPDAFLKRALPWIRPLLSKAGAVVWIALVTAAIVTVVSQWDRARDQTQGILEPGNLLLLYGTFVLAKLVHEFGHAFATRRFGGEVHAMGVTLMVLTPIPYVDATAAWALRERWKRVFVGLAGMVPELALASLAAFVWAATGPGLLNSLAYNLMIVASVSTVVFNVNPLLRFDGYYILADLTDTPNLQQRAQRQLLHLVERNAFGGRLSESPARSPREAGWLAVYGVTSWLYRMFVTFSIILMVADRYFGLGLLAGLVTFVGSFVLPLVGAGRYLRAEPRIERVRRRAWLVTGGVGLAACLLLGAVPMPDNFRAPGVIRAADSQTVITNAAGFIEQVAPAVGGNVASGDLLVRMESPELDLDIASAEAEREQTLALSRQMLSELPAGIAPLQRRLEAVELRLAQLQSDRAGLVLRAGRDGVWHSPREDEFSGLWVGRGAGLGEVVGKGKGWEFLAVVPQTFAADLFGGKLARAGLRFAGAAGREVRVSDWKVVPGRQDLLPSIALGWPAQGPVRVVQDDTQGRRTAEPFFLVVARVDAAESGLKGLLWHERTGVIRFERPWRPLAWQWARSFRQMIQQRYQI